MLAACAWMIKAATKLHLEGWKLEQLWMLQLYTYFDNASPTMQKIFRFLIMEGKPWFSLCILYLYLCLCFSTYLYLYLYFEDIGVSPHSGSCFWEETLGKVSDYSLCPHACTTPYMVTMVMMILVKYIFAHGLNHHRTIWTLGLPSYIDEVEEKHFMLENPTQHKNEGRTLGQSWSF